jgi:hypothetical protein
MKKTLSKITNTSIKDIKYNDDDDDNNNNITKQSMQMKSTLYESCFEPFVVCISMMWSIVR